MKIHARTEGDKIIAKLDFDEDDTELFVALDAAGSTSPEGGITIETSKKSAVIFAKGLRNLAALLAEAGRTG